MATATRSDPTSPTADHPHTSSPDKHFINGGRSVRATRGFDWLALGFSFFIRSPVVWIGAAIIYWTIEVVLNLIPNFGPIAIAISAPVFAGGAMYGCHKLEKGQPFRIHYFLVGFTRHLKALLVIGLLSVIATFAPLFFVIGPMLRSFEGRPTTNLVAMNPAPLVALMLITFVMLLASSAALVHTPALIVLCDLGPAEAIKCSFRGCMRNTAPFIVYCITILLFLVGTVGIFFFVLQELGMWGLIIVGIPYLIACSSAMIASLFAAFRDIFYEGEAA